MVASSNNGAVENVTLEIPSAEVIDEPWRERARGIAYFPALAGRAMGAGRSMPGSADGEAWALIAAVVGIAALAVVGFWLFGGVASEEPETESRP